ncbi:MAG: VWA domain-containing protein, partial [Calditrichaeota bacterium]
MFTFLNSILAWALFAAAIPILIHLFTRKKLKTISFSTLRFLKLMQQEKIRQVRLRQLLLLLLRTLIIALLVLAFMRPTVKNSRFIVGQRARTSMAILVDNSLSMARMTRGKSLLSQVKIKAQEILQLMQPGDEVYLISVAQPSQFVGDHPILSPDKALEALRNVRQTASGTDLQGALELALKSLGTTHNLNKEIYLLSDNKFSLQFEKAAGELPPNLQLFVLDWPEEKIRNLSVTALNLNNQIFELNKVVDVTVKIANTGQYRETGRLVHLILNGSRVAQQQVDVPAGQERQIKFRIVPERQGYQFLSAEIENDQIPLDNHRFAVFSIPEKLRVLLLGPTPQDRLFVRLALVPEQNSGSMILQEMDSRHPGTLKLDEFDEVILCNVPQLSSEFARSLYAFAKNGGGVMVFMGEDVDLRNYNEELFNRFHLGRLGETLGSLTAKKQILRFGKIRLDHPIFKGIFAGMDGDGRHIDSPAFNFAVYAHPSPDAETIMEYSNRAPFLLERKIGEGLILAFMSSADPT